LAGHLAREEVKGFLVVHTEELEEKLDLSHPAAAVYDEKFRLS